MDVVYKEVVDGVISSCRSIFAEEGVDEQVLDELRQIWEEKVKANTKEKPVEKPKSNWGQKIVKANPAPNINTKDETQASSSGVTQVKIVPIQVKLPPSATQPARKLCINVPASSLQNKRLQKLLTGSIISSTLNLPAEVATAMLQEHINLNMGLLLQLDGTDYDSSDDDEESLTEDEGDEEETDAEIMQEGEDDPLNSDDDVSEEDMAELYDTDNVVVCQYDKIGRNRNKWKFFLKDGILHTKNTEYPFQRATGEAEW